MRLPFSPTQTAVGVGLLVVLVALVIIVILIRRARARAMRRARTEAALGAPNPSSTLPAPKPPTIRASPPRYPPGGRGLPPLASAQEVERSPTEPILIGQRAPAGLADRPAGDAEQNGAGSHPPGDHPPDGTHGPGATDRPDRASEDASEDEPTAGAGAEEAGEPFEPSGRETGEPEHADEPDPAGEWETAVNAEPGTAERSAEGPFFAAPVMASAEIVRRGDTTPALATSAARAAGADVADPKDRLLRVLLTDPDRALVAVGDLEACRQRLDKLHQSINWQRRQLADAARRLRGAGLSPAQVARLAGFGEGELVSLLAEHAPSPVPRAPRPKPPPAASDAVDSH